MEEITYLDFDLSIQREQGGYRARADSPAGQAAVAFTLPFSDLELENFLLRVGRTRRGTRRIDSPEVTAAKAFGERLFSSVFAGEVRGCLRSSIEEARRRGGGVRIRLRLADAPELADLPWEYLYNPNLNRFLSLSTETPVVRYLDLPERIEPLLVSPPVRVLVMISSPVDFPGLDVEREVANLHDALGDLERRGLVAIERLPGASLSALQRRLRQGSVHVFHFVGHGGFDQASQDGVLVLEGDGRRGRPVSGQDLGLLLHDHRPLRLAVLNACEGARTSRTDPFAGTAQSLVQQGLAAVIAMQFEITDEAAIVFAREFYGAVADGYPVDAALAEARKTIFAQDNRLEWGTPVLYLRAPDGRIFDIKAPITTEPDPRIRAGQRPADQSVRPREAALAVDADRPVAPLRDTAPTAAPALRPDRPARARKAAVALLAAAAAAIVVAAWRFIAPAPPVIDGFTADPPAVTQGAEVAISWHVHNADAVRITDPLQRSLDVGSHEQAGTVTVVPAARGAHEFLLVARRGGRSTQQHFTVTVTYPRPEIKVFEASPPSAGQPDVALKWDVVNATSVKIEPEPGTVAAKGDLRLKAPPGAQTTRYALTASNPDTEPVERSVVLDFQPVGVGLEVRQFDAQPAEITLGQQTSLSWNAPGAEAASISGLSGKRGATGSVTVTPQQTGKIVYTLTATMAGRTATRTVAVLVHAPKASSVPAPAPAVVPRPASVPAPAPAAVPRPASVPAPVARPPAPTPRPASTPTPPSAPAPTPSPAPAPTLYPVPAPTVHTAPVPAPAGPAVPQAAGTLVATVTSVDFGSMPLGTKAKPQTITLRNEGPGPVTVQQIALGGDRGDFSIDDPCSKTTIAAGHTCVLTVGFAPTVSASRSASLTLMPASGSAGTVWLRGTGMPPPPASGVLVVGPETVDFGSLPLGTKAKPQTITLRNPGPGPVTVQQIALAGDRYDFTVDDPCSKTTLAPGGACTLTVGFAPIESDSRKASLTLTPAAPASAQTVSLRGMGMIPAIGAVTAAPTRLDFGLVYVNTKSKAQVVTLRNSGPGSVTIQQIALSGERTNFVVADQCTGTTLAAGATCTVSISLNPQALGAHSASLMITTSAPGIPLSVALEGTGFKLDPHRGLVTQ